MDYQTFNSQQNSFSGPYSTPLPGAPTHLAQPTHSPQQQQLYVDPNARFQSSPSPFPNGQAGGFPINMGGGSVAASGAMMQPGGLSQNQLHQARAALQHQQWQHQQQQQLHSPSPYSTAPFSQSLPSPAHQQFAQNRQTASPLSATSTQIPPYAAQQIPQQLSPSLVPSSSQQPMAAPAAAQSQTSQSMQTQPPLKAVPQSPVSPAAQARERERISTLLEINLLLIKEGVELQTQGKAGQIAAPAQDVKPEGEKQQATKEYLDLMRRLQANLAFLAQHAEKNHKPNQPIQPGPAIMAAPSSPPQLVELYVKLQSLFPGWKGQAGPMKSSPGLQRLNPTSQQPNSAGVQNSMQPPNSAGLPQNLQQPATANNAAQNNIQQQSSTPPHIL